MKGVSTFSDSSYTAEFCVERSKITVRATKGVNVKAKWFTCCIFKISVALVFIGASPQQAIAKLADRGRLVNVRKNRDKTAIVHDELPIEGPAYRVRSKFENAQEERRKRKSVAEAMNIANKKKDKIQEELRASWKLDEKASIPEFDKEEESGSKFENAQEERRKRKSVAEAMNIANKKKDKIQEELRASWKLDEKSSIPEFDKEEESDHRELSNQLTGCCTTYTNYNAMSMCGSYGIDCTTGQMPSHDSGDDDCSQEGLSFIGISFSVNTGHGNPRSYNLCDQFPMENIIDRNYDYVMSMDEDGWLVGGGYKPFDYSGKMPYIDSSHTELLRIGSIDPEYGGTTIESVYEAMSSLSFPPFSVFPEYVKGGGGHHSGDDSDSGTVPSGDITMIVSIVEEYSNNDYSNYELFLDDLFTAMDSVGGGPCMDDHDTDPHVSMARGVKFKSSYHEQQYFFHANLEIAVWQAAYPSGVVIGSTSLAAFPPDRANVNRKTVGYGNLYFFFDRANITASFPPNRDLSTSEEYYSTLYKENTMDVYYETVTKVDFDYSGSGSGDDNQYYEHNPYSWNAKMAKHDMTDGWDLPPNCNQEGEGFFGIPLSRKSESDLQKTATFQNQFDFEYILDRNFTYMKKFGTNHGWLVGEEIGNGAGSIVDKDTAHIPIFYYGTTNVDMGGVSLADLIKIAKKIEFGTLYIKPAFVFQDDDGSLKLQFEADANSALGYLYDNFCKQLGISWNYEKPSNDIGVYGNCAMHAAGDRAKYGCGPENAGSGGFCPQMTLAYSVGFQSEDMAAAYIYKSNAYVDYWRSLYPSGVAVGTDSFCENGGCLGLFLNRQDLFQVFKPDLGGYWIEYNDATAAPTISPAPTYDGGCDNPHNSHLDMCFRRHHQRKASTVAWESLGAIGQLSITLVAFMATTLSISIFLSRARKRKRIGESYVGFFMRDLKRKKKRKRLKKRDRKELREDMLPERYDQESPKDESSRRTRSRSRSKSRGRSSSRAVAMRERARKVAEKHDEEIAERTENKRARSRSRSRHGRSQSRNRRKEPSRDAGDAGKGRSHNSSIKRRQLV